MIELSYQCGESTVEALSDALEAAGALSVSVEDADAGAPDESALFGEPGLPPPAGGWARSRLRALFATEDEARAAVLACAASGAAADAQMVGMEPVLDADWVRLTQAQFTPVEITPSFWVVPTWHEPPAAATRAIRLDPGLAFGTGTHPTTRMCLRWIAASPIDGRRVLDYGCGSGILAIGAALFGARAACAVDIDDAAVESSRANARANGVVAVIECGPPDAAQGRYDVVLANILATPLKLLAPLLVAHVAPGGSLVLAGILERQAGELTDAYAPFAHLTVADTEDGWVLMTATIKS